MSKLYALLTWLNQKKEAQDMTEYAILVVVIALVVILGAAVFGNQLSTWFVNLTNDIPIT